MPAPNPTDANTYATKADLETLHRDLIIQIKETQITLMKWTFGLLMFFTTLQTAIIALLVRGLR